MNDHPTPSPSQPDAPLNLKKFAPGQPSQAEVTSPESEGQTLFIKKTAAVSAPQLPGSAAPANDQEFGLPLKDMLGIITYCYARGVFSSKEIAERLKQEPQLRKGFGRNLPDEATIKTFRRRYATEIEDLLETVFRVYPPTDPKVAPDQDAGQTETLRREAVERVHDAAWEDSMRRHLH